MHSVCHLSLRDALLSSALLNNSLYIPPWSILIHKFFFIACIVFNKKNLESVSHSILFSFFETIHILQRQDTIRGLTVGLTQLVCTLKTQSFTLRFC